MGRRRKMEPSALVARLAEVKIMIADMGDALPATARDLRRNACETLDEVIVEIAPRGRLKEMSVTA